MTANGTIKRITDGGFGFIATPETAEGAAGGNVNVR
jgi:hypothetical protein